MKKILLVLSFAFFGLQSFAQSDALDTWFNNHFWFNLAPHDSLIFDFTDSTGPYNVEVSQTITSLRKGVLSSSDIFLGTSTTPDGIIRSAFIGNITRVFEIDQSSGSMDTVLAVDFHEDAMGRDTLMELWENNGNGLELAQRYVNTYNGSIVSNIEVFEQDNGAWVKFGEFQNYISNGRIDSVDLALTINGTNITFQKLISTYQGNRQISFEIYEISTTSNSFELQERTLFAHDANDNIIEGINSSFNTGSGNDGFSARIKYLRKNGSNVSLDEQSLMSISLYPNPATDELRVEGSSVFSYEISNVAGLVVKHGASKDGSINIETLDAGAYHLMLLSENGQQSTERFVKQ
jgi:hypothetical protein